MHDWLIRGLKVGCYYEAKMLNEQRGFEDLHTFSDKMVKSFDKGIEAGGADASNYISFVCAIRATKNMKKGQLRELLNDTSFLNTKNAPSLVYVEVGNKVCALSSESCGQTRSKITVFALDKHAQKSVHFPC